MSHRSLPVPGRTAPHLEFPVLGVPERRWNLTKAEPKTFSLLVFYRGLHCPVCRKYLQELDRKMDDFRARGVEAVALSMNSEDRAQTAKQRWEIENLPIGFDVSEETAKDWGLFVSEGMNPEEPRRFSEPGLFLVRPDGTLFYAAVNSMPFGRPRLDDVLDTIDFVEREGYPARGRAAD